ncbi:MAG: hypothetical protein ACR2LH_10735 [Thermoleophilaceae bacterium]
MTVATAPCPRLRAALADARAAGLDFADAWPTALAGTLAAVDDDDERPAWSAVLADTAEQWAAAYRHAPAPAPQLALVLLGQDPERCEPFDLADTCAHCGGPIGRGKRSTARYCSGRCRRDAHVARAAAA